MNPVTEQFLAARDFLVANRENYTTAVNEFEWPRFDSFNFATDWFDYLATQSASKNREAIVINEQDGSSTRRTYSEMSKRSQQLANWLTDQGVKRGDHVMLMIQQQPCLAQMIFKTAPNVLESLGSLLITMTPRNSKGSTVISLSFRSKTVNPLKRHIPPCTTLTRTLPQWSTPRLSKPAAMKLSCSTSPQAPLQKPS